MNNITIRVFESADISGIQDILKAVGWDQCYVQGQIDSINKIAADITGDIKVAQFQDRVVGYIQAEHKKWNRLSFIHGLIVHPEFQRRQIAKNLVAAVEATAKQRNNRGIFLDTPVTNEGARVFYRAIGMAESYIMPEYYEPGLDGVTYQKLFISS